jgi:hypothetical protein
MKSGVSAGAVLEHLENLDVNLPGMRKKRSRAKGVMRWTAMATGALGLVAAALAWAPWRRRSLGDATAAG